MNWRLNRNSGNVNENKISFEEPYTIAHTTQCIPLEVVAFSFKIKIIEGDLNTKGSRIHIGLKTTIMPTAPPGHAEGTLGNLSGEAKFGSIYQNGKRVERVPVIQLGDVIGCMVLYVKSESKGNVICQFSRNGEGVGAIQYLNSSELYPTVASTFSGFKFEAEINYDQFKSAEGIYK